MNSKEYKIVTQKTSIFMKDKDFEDMLNTEARNGWRVVSVVMHGGLKAILEKDRM